MNTRDIGITYKMIWTLVPREATHFNTSNEIISRRRIEKAGGSLTGFYPDNGSGK